MRALVPCLLAIVLAAAGCASDPDPDPVVGPTTELTTAQTSGSPSPWPSTLGGEHQDWTVRVLERLPHDTMAFTQGLELGAGGLIESTGREGESTLRLVDVSTGETLHTTALDDDQFGEGLTVVGDEIVQLTWRNGVALRYDADTLAPLDEFAYDGEGWGLCATDDEFWMSNGSAELTRRDLTTFAPQETVTVRRGNEEIEALNELECIGDHVVANIWRSDEIVVIDPTTGAVAATIDASALTAEISSADNAAVLNGIADPGDGTLLLGGKLWPRFFLVDVVPAEGVTPRE